MPAALHPPALSYTRVRLGWCLAALIGQLRRWGIYLGVGVVVLGGTGNGAVAAMSGLTAWSVLPLIRVSQEPFGWTPLVAAAHSLAGALVVWGLRPLLWSRAWNEAERALPIAPAQRRLSDLLVVTLGLAPLFGAYVAGTVVWIGKSPAWMQGGWASWASFFVGLLMSMTLSVAWGGLILSSMRRPLRSGPAGRLLRTASAPARRGLSPFSAVVVLPLLRGPADRAGRLLLASVVALLLVDAALWRWPGLAAWWLAAFAALALVLTTRLNSVVTSDITPLHLACTPLALAPATLLRARRVVALLPQFVGQAMLLVALVPVRHAVRPAVLVAYMLAAIAGAIHQVVTTTAIEGLREHDPAHRVSIWLFTLVLLVALASEVIRR